MRTFAKIAAWPAVGLVALLAAGVVVAQDRTPPRPDTNGPSMEITDRDFDFGKVFESDHYVHDFVVHNRGKADLVIEEVHPSCGCTVANFDKVIPPGGVGKIQLVLDGHRVSGQFYKTAAVRSNDPVKRQFQISITGTKIPYVNIEPQGTLVMQGRYGEPVAKKLTVSSNEDDLHFKINSITSNIDDKVTYTYKPTVNPGQYEIEVFKNKELPTLTTYGTLFLHTNSEKKPKQEIQVYVITRGMITVSPATLNFGAVRFGDKQAAGVPVTKSIILSKSTGEFEISDITLNNPNFRASPEVITPGKQYRVEVIFTPPMKKLVRDNESADMIVKTTDPLEPAIRVTVVARAM